MTDNEGQQLLAPLRELEPDFRSGVDITKAKRVGRRTSRRRTVLGATAVVGVFALVGASVAVLSGVPRDAVDPAAAPAEFGPLTEVVTVGTAGGFRPTWYTTGADAQRIDLVRDDGKTGEGSVSVYPGAIPWYASASLQKFQNRSTAGQVTFEWTPGSWAVVVVIGEGSDLQARAEQVRQNVLVRSQRARVPFTVDKSALGGMRPVGVSRSYDDSQPIKATVELSPSDQPERGGLLLTATSDGYGPGPKENLGGHEATLVGNDYGVWCIGISDRASKLNLTVLNVGDKLPLAKAVVASVRFAPAGKWIDADKMLR